LSKLAQQQPGRACLIRDLQLTAVQGAARRNGASCSAVLEVVQWEVQAYLEHLQKLAAAARAAAKAAAAQAAAAAASACQRKSDQSVVCTQRSSSSISQTYF
jgi:hypothetical protein